MTAAVRFDNVSKRFTLHHERPRSFQELAINFFQRNDGGREEFWALKNVSFVVEPGEVLGIIGANGSGKSTALKLVARILEPTLGTVPVNGRVSALLEVGAGFHPDLTGQENIYLNGSILGLSKRDMDRKFDDILEFSGLERFIDTPVRHYSSGMYMRLGFSVAVHVEPDILLVDEVLAVGDHAFQRKCLEKIYELKRQGMTILFVSHETNAVRWLCDRAIWLDQGETQAQGAVNDVVSQYIAHVRSEEEERLRGQRDHDRTGERWGSGEVEILDVRFLDGQGQERSTFEMGEPMTARLYYRAHERIEKPMFGVAIYHDSGVHINGPNTVFSDYDIPFVEGEGWVDYRIDSLPLQEGKYWFTATIYNYTGTHAYDHHQQMYTFKVYRRNSNEIYGLFYIPGSWDHQKVNDFDG